MTAPWGDLGTPGHINRGGEYEGLTDMFTAWDEWTPTITNLTQGSGSILALYKHMGRTVHYRFRFTYGAGSAVGTSPRFTLPVAPASTYVSLQDPMGDADLLDSGTANRRGQVLLVSGSTVEIFSYSTTGVLTTITATVPQTWAAGDVLACVGMYESAAYAV